MLKTIIEGRMEGKVTIGRSDRLADGGWIQQNGGESPTVRGVAALDVRTCLMAENLKKYYVIGKMRTVQVFKSVFLSASKALLP